LSISTRADTENAALVDQGGWWRGSSVELVGFWVPVDPDNSALVGRGRR
jgi:hypothetical protein